MSVVVSIGVDASAAQARAAAPEVRARRRRERLMIAGGTCFGLLLLAALPLPRIRDARAQQDRCVTLEEKVERARADAAAVRAWESGEREQAPALHAEYRRWFSAEKRLLETRNHLTQAARAIGLQITDVTVADGADAAGADAPDTMVGFAIPATREIVQVTGKGRTAEVALLGAMLPRLDPPLRLMSWEFSGPPTERAFTIVAERFYEERGPGSR